MQGLNKRFYSYVAAGICPRVPLKQRSDFTELMRQQVTRVMLFSRQPNSYTLSHETGYKWVTKPLFVIDPLSDLPFCPTQWPKNCQIAPNLWLFFGGINLEESALPNYSGTKLVTQLDTSTQRLKILTEMPALMMAH
jgi:hypothetical protein